MYIQTTKKANNIKKQAKFSTFVYLLVIYNDLQIKICKIKEKKQTKKILTHKKKKQNNGRSENTLNLKQIIIKEIFIKKKT